MLKALDDPTVHLFSLDVEGSEPDVLKTIPWNKVDIHVFLIEYGGYKYRKVAIRPLLVKRNYTLIGTVVNKDLIFVRNDVINRYDLNLDDLSQFNKVNHMIYSVVNVLKVKFV